MRAKPLFTAAVLLAVLTLLLGLLYPWAVTGLAQLLFSDRANGSLIRDGGVVRGSRLIGQPFTGPAYFHPRPSPSGYVPPGSLGSNLAPANRRLWERMRQDVQRLRAERPDASIPVDLVTASGSGLDPHISPAAADFQVPRVARARGLTEDEVRRLVARHTEGRWLGLLGEPRVNVLELNLKLDRRARRTPPSRP